MTDLHGEAGVSMRDLEEEADKTVVAEADERAGYDDDTPAARWHGVTAAPATDPLAADDDDHDDRVPRAVKPFLLADENDIIALQLSAWLLLLPAAVLFGSLALAVFINAQLYYSYHATADAVHIIWIAWLCALIWAAYRWYEWRQTWFVVTGHRLLLIHTKKLVSRDVSQLPIDKMRDVRLIQPVFGRLLRYGTLDFASIGTERALDMVRFLPYPEWLYREINALKMPDTERKPMKVKRAPGSER